MDDANKISQSNESLQVTQRSRVSYISYNEAKIGGGCGEKIKVQKNIKNIKKSFFHFLFNNSIRQQILSLFLHRKFYKKKCLFYIGNLFQENK